MEFHPDKCTLLRITNKRTPIENTYTIHNVALESQTAAKYLGITIDNRLSWDDHCNAAYRKASSMLSFLERNIQKCPRQTKINCYNALVRPMMEYGCCVWDPHKIYQINKLEKLNKRAARFITGNYHLEHGESKKI